MYTGASGSVTAITTANRAPSAEEVNHLWPSMIQEPSRSNAVVDVSAAGLDESVGVEHERVAVVQLDLELLERRLAGAERDAGVVVQDLRRPGAADQQGRQVAGVADADGAVDRVVDGVHTGDDRRVVETAAQVIQVRDDVERGEVLYGVAAHHCAKLTHQGRRADAAAHDVTDHDRDTSGRERNHVVPVAADLTFVPGRVVRRGGLQVFGFRQCAGQQ